MRVDLFRGLALWFMFLDHIPTNVVSWLTVRNYGFSDATEIFVFISGYTAVIAYARMMQREGWPRAAIRIWRRVWQLYVAHILLFVAFPAQIAWVSIARDTPALIKETELLGLGENPYRAILEAALLKFRPVNLDVLPLYIVLLGRLSIRAACSLASALDRDSRLARPLFGNLPLQLESGSLSGQQGLVLQSAGLAGGLPSRGGVRRARPADRPLPPAAGRPRCDLFPVRGRHRLVVALQSPGAVDTVLDRAIYPIDKTNVDSLRILHFLALAWLVRLAVPADAAFLRWPVLRPLRRCGEQSLLIFCLGTFLALPAQVIVSQFEESLLPQVVVSVAGILIMCLAAYAATWFKGGGPAGPSHTLATEAVP